MYNNVANNIDLFVVNTPNTIVPIPIDDDYSIGFIRRYFVRKANDEHGFTYEIAKDEYAEYIRISSNLNKRMMNMLVERLKSQLQVIEQ